MVRKRAPGGGMKPKGPYAGKTATLTTRITGATRAGLEKAAQESGLSLSQVVEHRLDASLNQSVLSASGRRNQALASAVALLAARLEGMTGRSWRQDAFTGQALIAAVGSLIASFMPPVDAEPAVPQRLAVHASQLRADEQATYHRPQPFGIMLAFTLITEIEEAAKEGSEYPIGIRWPEATGVIWKIKRDLDAAEEASS